MAQKLPPTPTGSPPGSAFWNQWYEQLRLIVNDGLVSVLWSNIDFSGSNLTDLVNRAHNNLQSIQGGTPGQYYHMTAAQNTALNSGYTGSVALAKLTSGGANGSLTVSNGIITGYTAPT